MPSYDGPEQCILHVLATPTDQSRQLVTSLLDHAAAHDELSCAVASSDHALAAEVNARGAAFHRLPDDGSSKRGTARNGATMRTVLDRSNPAVVHLHDESAGQGLRLALLGRSAPPVVMSVYEGQEVSRATGRLLNRSPWTAVAAGPMVAQSLRQAGHHGRLRTILSGGTWDEPTLSETAAARARWGIEGPYIVALAADQNTADWPAVLEAMRRVEGVRLVLVDDTPGTSARSLGTNVVIVPGADDYQALVAGALATISTSSSLPTQQILGPLSIGVPVIAGAQDTLRGWIPGDAALLIDLTPANVVAAVGTMAQASNRRTLSARGRDAARSWATDAAMDAYASLYALKASRSLPTAD